VKFYNPEEFKKITDSPLFINSNTNITENMIKLQVRDKKVNFLNKRTLNSK
jgi:hypothetical protein